jgi:hypothetical protein
MLGLSMASVSIVRDLVDDQTNRLKGGNSAEIPSTIKDWEESVDPNMKDTRLDLHTTHGDANIQAYWVLAWFELRRNTNEAGIRIQMIFRISCKMSTKVWKVNIPYIVLVREMADSHLSSVPRCFNERC